MINCCEEAAKAFEKGEIISHSCGQSENRCPKCGTIRVNIRCFTTINPGTVRIGRRID